MSRVAAAIPALALGLAAAIALASCGGGGNAKLLPGTTAQEITENLESVRELAAEGECADAEDKAVQVSSQVADLQGIDQKLKEALQAGAERLNEVVLTCAEATTEEETEETLPTEATTAPTKPEKVKPGKEKHEETEPPETEPAEPPAETEPPASPKGEANGQEEQSEGGPSEAPSGGIGPGSESGGGG